METWIPLRGRQVLAHLFVEECLKSCKTKVQGGSQMMRPLHASLRVKCRRRLSEERREVLPGRIRNPGFHGICGPASHSLTRSKNRRAVLITNMARMLAVLRNAGFDLTAGLGLLADVARRGSMLI